MCLEGHTSSSTNLIDDKEIFRISKVGYEGLWLQLISTENPISKPKVVWKFLSCYKSTVRFLLNLVAYLLKGPKIIKYF